MVLLISMSKTLGLLCMLLAWFFCVGLMSSSPVPSPDFKSAVVDQLRKLPKFAKSLIPMPDNIAVAINVDNRDAEAVAAADAIQRANERRDMMYPEHGQQGFLHVSQQGNGSGNGKFDDIPDHHVLAMVLISIGVFLIGTIFVLTLWFCFRRKKHITIIATPNNVSETTSMRPQYNSPKAEELLPKMPNVQKLIADFNK